MNQYNPYAPIQPDVIDRWLQSQDISQNSKEKYQLGLRTFCQYIQDCALDFDELETKDVNGFKAFLLNDKKLSPATVSTYLAGVRAFYRHAEDDGLQNIARNVKGASVTRDFKKDTLTPEQANKLLKTLKGNTLAAKRDFAIVNLMLRTGLRDTEVVSANIGDLKAIDGTSVLYIRGKGRSAKDAFVLLTSKSVSPILDYLDSRAKTCDKDPLFASVAHRNMGGRLTTRSVSRIVKNAMRAIGLDSERYTAHSLRHTAITFALLGGATEREAQEMARHASINTTMIYSHHINRMKDAAELKIGAILDDV